MNIVKMQPSRPARESKLSDLWTSEKDSERMYAIAFDLDTVALKVHYNGGDTTNAYHDIAREFKQHGFERQQGSVYFGNRGMTSVNCVLAVQAVSNKHAWFAKVVKDIRMLRIEENNDLMPAIGQLDLPLSPRAANG